MEIDRTYQQYLADIRNIDITKIARTLGLTKDRDGHTIRLFNTLFSVRQDGFFSSSNSRPPYGICIVLCKYLLMCPQTEPEGHKFVSYKDFKDSGPLTAYFTSDVENLICRAFVGRLDALQAVSKSIGGTSFELQADYDLMMQFNALPKLPMVLLFNDRDEEFPCQTKILFEQRAEQYLDAECLAIIGNLLFQWLTF